MGISDTLNSLISDWTNVVKAGAGLAAIVLILVVAIVTKLAWGKLVITTIAAAFVIWAVSFNGLGWFSEGIDNELAMPAPSTTVIAEPELGATV